MIYEVRAIFPKMICDIQFIDNHLHINIPFVRL